MPVETVHDQMLRAFALFDCGLSVNQVVEAMNEHPRKVVRWVWVWSRRQGNRASDDRAPGPPAKITESEPATRCTRSNGTVLNYTDGCRCANCGRPTGWEASDAERIKARTGLGLPSMPPRPRGSLPSEVRTGRLPR